MSSLPVTKLDTAGFEALARWLGDTPRTVITLHLLRQRLCTAYAVGDSSRPDAVVVRPTLLAEEPTAFGSDAESIWQILAVLSGWSCVNVEDEVAGRLGPIVEDRLGGPVRYLGDVYHTLERPAATFDHPAVRQLGREESDLLATAPAEIRAAARGFGSCPGLLAEGAAAGAVMKGELVALAATGAISPRHADLTVITAGPWRGRGLATACAALVAEAVQRAGRVPVWSAGETNAASLRVARKLGFEEVGRRTYVIPAEQADAPRGSESTRTRMAAELRRDGGS